MKPISFTEVLELGAPCEDVFLYMVDPKTAGTIDPSIVKWRSEDDPPKVGTLNHLTAKFLGVPIKMTSRFVECQPPHRMVLQGVRPPMARWTVGTHDLQEIPGGMRYTYEIEMRSPIGFRLVHRVMARMMHRGVRMGCRRLLEVFGPARSL